MRVVATTEPQPATPKQHKSPWLWVSLGLGIVAIGALVWAFATTSDLNDTQSKLDSTEQQLASTQKKLDATPTATPAKTPTPTPEENDGNALLTAGAIGAVTALYKDLKDELGATQEDLAQTQKDLDAANQQAQQAEKDAAAAKEKADNANDATAKAQAEADQANAEKEAAQSKAKIAAECAKAYVGAFGTLFEGNDVKAQAEKVREQLSQIHDDCQAAFASA